MKVIICNICYHCVVLVAKWYCATEGIHVTLLKWLLLSCGLCISQYYYTDALY